MTPFPLKIFFADLTYFHQGIQSEIMPYAIGSIAAYTKARLGSQVDLSIFKHPVRFIEAMSANLPGIVCFTNYAWNTRLELSFAQHIKKHFPGITIIMGGPNYPLDLDQKIDFLKRHCEIDFYIEGEGEAAFGSLIAHFLAAQSFEKIDVELGSVHYIRKDGKAVINSNLDRIVDLSTIPSPYLEGFMDKFFDEGFWPIIQTSRGCPFSCTFCVEGSHYYSNIHRYSLERIRQELHDIGRKMMPVMAKGGRADLFIADSNFGMYKEDIATCEIIRECQDQYGWPKYISVATGKNNKDRVLEAAKLVRGALRLSGSVQSLDTEVLTNIKRKNVSAEQIMRVAIEGAEIGANTYSEIILGLPGDSRAKHMGTVSRLMEAQFNKVETYTLMLLHGSELMQQESRKRFDLLTKFRVIPRCFGHFDFFGDQFAVAEIEEVVVENATLSFDDYLYCRMMALVVALFHNDGLFSLCFSLLRRLDVPVFDCLIWIQEELYKSGDVQSLNKGNSTELVSLFKKFGQETIDELWDDYDDLSKFTSSSDNIRDFISGDRGSNLLFKYKSMAMIGHVRALGEMLAQSIESILSAKLGGLSISQKTYIQHLAHYGASGAVNIFENYCADIELSTPFDWLPAPDKERFLGLGNDNLESNQTFVFSLNPDQIDTIERTLKVYGGTIPGLTRALTRVNLKRLMRSSRLLAAASPAKA